MRCYNYIIPALLGATIALSSCNKETDNVRPIINDSSIHGGISVANRLGLCPEEVVCLVAGQHIDVGSVEIANNEDNIYITLNMTGGWTIGKAHLYIGNDLASVSNNGNPAPGQFPYHSPNNMNVTTYTFEISRTGLDECNSIAVHAEVNNGTQSETAWACGDNFPGANWATFIAEYCMKTCDDPIIPLGCEGFRTQTQGGWGARPSGNNNGTYLHANFAGSFQAPDFLTVGCDKNLRFTTAQAITNFLPQGGTPAALAASAFAVTVNPTGKINVLAGQVVALKLNVTFDRDDPNFASSLTNLGDLVVASGPFAGKTVDEVLEIGEKVLGRCASPYSPSAVNDAISMINESYTDGIDQETGFLECPTL